jgi:hypothetical protein
VPRPGISSGSPASGTPGRASRGHTGAERPEVRPKARRGHRRGVPGVEKCRAFRAHPTCNASTVANLESSGYEHSPIAGAVLTQLLAPIDRKRLGAGRWRSSMARKTASPVRACAGPLDALLAVDQRNLAQAPGVPLVSDGELRKREAYAHFDSEIAVSEGSLCAGCRRWRRRGVLAIARRWPGRPRG